MNRNEMVEALSSNICSVVFKKVNGENRTMKATLRKDMVPETKNHKNNDEVIPVWDTENNGWRSFRVDSVTDFKVA